MGLAKAVLECITPAIRHYISQSQLSREQDVIHRRLRAPSTGIFSPNDALLIVAGGLSIGYDRILCVLLQLLVIS